MIVELVGVGIALFGGVCGIFGETKDKAIGKVTRLGWISLGVVILGFAVGVFQVTTTAITEADMKRKAAERGYTVLADVYKPLSSWLEATEGQGSGVVAVGNFPADTGLGAYDALHKDPDLAAQRAVERLMSIKDPNGRPDYRALVIWGANYRQAINALNPPPVSLASLPDEVSGHLIELSHHSLFVRAAAMDVLGGQSGAQCRGSIATLTEQIADPAMDPMWRVRCQTILVHELALALKDESLPPPFTKEMEGAYRRDCQDASRLPFCASGPSASGLKAK